MPSDSLLHMWVVMGYNALLLTSQIAYDAYVSR
jgi:hypothetical protein